MPRSRGPRKGARIYLNGQGQLMKTNARLDPTVEAEPLATRVALHPFLAGMNRAQLALLTDCAMAAHFETGQTILREGEFANRCYLIETGKAVVESGGTFTGPLVIEAVGAGDLLGWSWMFPPYVWQFTARAVEPTSYLFLRRDAAGVLREGSFVRLRTFKTDKRGDGEALAGCP